MSFKRIAGDINEVAIATMDETIGSSIYHPLPPYIISVLIAYYIIVLVLARVFVNSDTQKMYEHLFRDLFTLIEEASGASVQWQHIHGSGNEAVLVDTCNKQASGKSLL